MKNVSIIEDNAIIALDLKNILSKYLNVLEIISKPGAVIQNSDYLIVDTDVFKSSDELNNIISSLNFNAKVILISSQLQKNIITNFTYVHYILKPFSSKEVLQAIET